MPTRAQRRASGKKWVRALAICLMLGISTFGAADPEVCLLAGCFAYFIHSAAKPNAWEYYSTDFFACNIKSDFFLLPVQQRIRRRSPPKKQVKNLTLPRPRPRQPANAPARAECAPCEKFLRRRKQAAERRGGRRRGSIRRDGECRGGSPAGRPRSGGREKTK